MTPTVVLPVIIGGLYAAGVYLLLDRSLTRVLLGVLLLGNATNLLLLSAGGPAGLAPILGYAEPDEMSDPLPQALILTAIVITFGDLRVRPGDHLPLLAAGPPGGRGRGRGGPPGGPPVGHRCRRARPGPPRTRGPAGRARGQHALRSEAEAALDRHYPGIPSDDVDLPATRGEVP